MRSNPNFARYAELLRRAWLNPSYKPWQMDVHRFEHEHHDELKPYFSEWQENGRNSVALPPTADGSDYANDEDLDEE